MNYILIFVSMVILFSSASCTSADANTVSAAAPITNNLLPAAPSETPVSAAAECKICKFDHAAYKGELAREEIDGLLLALNDEYMATATYEQVNRDFGDPRPFVNIVRAEQRHAERLKALFTKYGVAVPDNPWPGSVDKYSSVTDACKAGVDGEVNNRDLYTRLFKTTDRADIVAAYKDLQRASEENHLPAFERCASGGGRGPGNGRGRGNGRGPGGN